MATDPRSATVTLEDFIAAAEASEERLEFVDGQIVAMGAATLNHGRITQRVALSLGIQFQGSSCEVVSQGTMVASGIADNAFVPDLAVFCGEPELRRVRGGELLLNPVLLIEVLSPSTTQRDHTVKLENYRLIPSLQEYLIVSQDRPRIERYARHSEHFWMYGVTEGAESELRLDTLGVTLSLASTYAGLSLEVREDG